MNGLRRRILNHALKNRRNPGYNRRRVGKNLSVLTVFVFFVFLINFAIIIGTGKKFGVNLAEQTSKSGASGDKDCTRKAWNDL